MIPKHCRRKILLALKVWKKPGPLERDFERAYNRMVMKHWVDTLLLRPVSFK